MKINTSRIAKFGNGIKKGLQVAGELKQLYDIGKGIYTIGKPLLTAATMLL
jgi:hypothetical protein